MNINESNDDALRWQLRALRTDIKPARDLWPDIAARIAATPVATTPANVVPLRRRAPRWLPLATAASLLLAVGLVWQQEHLAPSPGEPLIRQEADALTRQYQGALAEIALSSPQSGQAYTPALKDLDHSAAQIRTAIQRDPDSRLLLEQLHRTYARRLALSQRAALT